MNIFKQPAGNLTGLLATRPFLVGEIFIQTLTDSGKKYVDVSKKNIYDRVTGAKINQLYPGDIYGGCGFGTKTNTTAEGGKCFIYQLGSGNALKFGSQLLYTWDQDTQEIVKNHPNTLYLYVGPKVDAQNRKATEDFKVGVHEDPKVESKEGNFLDTEDWVGDAGRYYANQSLSSILDSGDFVFWHPVYSQEGATNTDNLGMFFYWHNSRTVDSLVRLTASRLTSISATAQLDTLNKGIINETLEGGNPVHSNEVSLLDYLNGPARLTQSLIEEQGWEALKFSEGEDTTYTNKDGQTVTVKNPSTVLSYDYDRDGSIHYVPFTATWTGTGAKGEKATFKKDLSLNGDKFSVNFTCDPIVEKKVRPGDIIISVPDFTTKIADADKITAMYKDAYFTANGISREENVTDAMKTKILEWANNQGLCYGVKHVVISLYADYLERMDPSKVNIERADGYATDRWSPEDEALMDAAAKSDGVSIIDFIENLYKTKVDIDPVTGKVITSQLPEFLLGAMKYLGTIVEGAGHKVIKDGYYRDDKGYYKLEEELEREWNQISEDDISDYTGLSSDDVLEAYWSRGETEDDLDEVAILVKGTIKAANDEWYNRMTFTNAELFHNFINSKVSVKDYVSEEEATRISYGHDDQDPTAILSTDYLVGGSKAIDGATPAQSLVWAIINQENDETIEGEEGENYDKREDGTHKDVHEDTDGKDVDGDTDKNGKFDQWDKESAKGYYFIWSGCKLDLQGPNANLRAYFSTTALNDNDEVEDANDKKVTSINPGDFLIFNGETFDVVDNSDSLVGLDVTTNTGFHVMLDGVPTFKGDKSTSSSAKTFSVDANGNHTNWDGDMINRVDYNVTKQTNGLVQIVSPGQVVFKVLKKDVANQSSTSDSDYETTVDATYIPLVSSEGIIHNSRLFFSDGTPKAADGTPVDKELSVLTYNDSDLGTSLDFNKDVFSKQYIFGFSSVGTLGTKKFDHIFLNGGIGEARDADGNGVGYSGPVASKFSFNILDYNADTALGTKPELQLPDYSGTLTTEGYVNAGFGIVEFLLDEMYATITAGTVDYLQTVREIEGADGVSHKKIVDSYIAQKRVSPSGTGATRVAGEVWLKFQAYDEKDETHNTHVPQPTANNLIAKTEIKYDFEGDTTLRPDWHKELTTKSSVANPDQEVVVGVPTEGSKDVENVLPNHSGILLNSNSIIDCGFWSAESVDDGSSENA